MKPIIKTYETKYGKISLYSNDIYISRPFENGDYWDENTLLKLKNFIDPNKNILEIGAHCGTSTIVYASFLNENQKIYAYEPQKELYNLLVQNIKQNNLENKIIPFNKAVFCFSGYGNMNSIDLDGGGGNIQKRYNEEGNLPCNFGGACIGKNGENIEFTTIDEEIILDNIGYIHMDTQGSENFIFSKAINTISKFKPVIYYENNQENYIYLYNTVCNTYPEYYEESIFNIRTFCLEKLNYKMYIRNFNDGHDDLLVS